jgi:hypothetical protein
MCKCFTVEINISLNLSPGQDEIMFSLHMYTHTYTYKIHSIFFSLKICAQVKVCISTVPLKETVLCFVLLIVKCLFTYESTVKNIKCYFLQVRKGL